MIGLLHAMGFMTLLLVGWVIWNNKPCPCPCPFRLWGTWTTTHQHLFRRRFNTVIFVKMRQLCDHSGRFKIVEDSVGSKSSDGKLHSCCKLFSAAAALQNAEFCLRLLANPNFEYTVLSPSSNHLNYVKKMFFSKEPLLLEPQHKNCYCYFPKPYTGLRR